MTINTHQGNEEPDLTGIVVEDVAVVEGTVVVVDGSVVVVFVVVVVVVTAVVVVVVTAVVVINTGVVVVEVGAGFTPINANSVKCKTVAVTILFTGSTVPVNFCQAVPSHQAIYNVDSVTPAGKAGGLYLKLTLIPGLKFAPRGPNPMEDTIAHPAGGAGRFSTGFADNAVSRCPCVSMSFVPLAILMMMFPSREVSRGVPVTMPLTSTVRLPLS